MKQQNLHNHSRYVFLYHFVTLPLSGALVIGSIVNIAKSARTNLYPASLLLVAALLIASIAWYMRQFALRAQDRAIRAEESFRYFALTGKLLDSRLRMNQIIALRFAPNEEFPALCVQAAEQGLDASKIKKAIQTWRADHHRA